MNKSNISAYIPVFNEIKFASLIEENVENFLTVFPDGKVFFSDNCSTDGTLEFLKSTQDKFRDRVVVFSSASNLGYSKNFAKTSEIPPDDYVLLFSGNDKLLIDGLLKLKDLISNKIIESDYFITSWFYLNEDNKIEHGDISHNSSIRGLEDFFNKTKYVPIGIMQFVVKSKYLPVINLYSDLISPQVGLFFHLCRHNKGFLAGDICIALVARMDGWRSSLENNLLVHIEICKEVTILLSSYRDSLPPGNFKQVKERYRRIPLNMFFSSSNFKIVLNGKEGAVFGFRYFKNLLSFYRCSGSNLGSLLLDLILVFLKKIVTNLRIYK